ncbi:MAG: hypothetical protein HOB73_13200 [Planctomycetaceae bacterium]|jgi:hypothetical protein|nr:hypothetical protein [Planctomycetaceae bacterium]
MNMFLLKYKSLFMILCTLLLVSALGCGSDDTDVSAASTVVPNDAATPEQVDTSVSTDSKPKSSKGKVADLRNWVFSPYKMRIWIATDNSPRFQTIQNDRLQQEVRSYVRNWAGATLNVELETPPSGIYSDILHNFEDVTMLDIAALYEKRPVDKQAKLRAVQYDEEKKKAIAAAVKESEEKSGETASGSVIEDGGEEVDQVLIAPNPLPELDKIYAVSLQDRGGVFELQLVEFDTNARVRVLAASRKFRNLAMLSSQIFSCLQEVFSPISRIQYNGMTDGKTASIEMRSVGLVPDVNQDSPILLQKGDVLRPVVRRNNRDTDTPAYEGVIEVIWTYMFVNEVITHEEESLKAIRSNGSARGEVISTYTMLRNPLAARRNTAQQKYGLLVRPTSNSSLLKITAMGRDDYSLQGYNVFAKSPKIDLDDASDTPTIRIGQTDWRGGIEIDQDIFAGQGKTKLVVIYVKNGQRVLARLPIVPGYRPVETASLPNDDYRLQFEAFFVGLQNSVLDYTIQRKVYEIRIKHHVEKNEEKDARELLVELKKVPGLEDLDQILAAKEAGLQDNPLIDSTIRPQIDRMFLQTRELIGEFLQGNLLLEMTKLVNGKFGQPDLNVSSP